MHALQINNLNKIYGNGTVALKGVNLTVNEGDFFALLGPNGAGKSTTIGIISGLVNKGSGQVSVFGHDFDTDLAAAKACIGLVPQEFNFNQFEPIEEIVINQAGYYGIPRKLARERTEQYLKQLELWDKRHVAARQLSGGMKRRLMIARALVHQPKLLILDEPTAGVDIEIRRSMWAFLKQINAQGTTIILTTHYLEEAESLCRNIAIIDHGCTIEHTSMKHLLGQLNIETFIFYFAVPIKDSTVFSQGELANFDIEVLDDSSIEVCLEAGTHIHTLISLLSEQGLPVMTMRNKTNRLEQLFMRLVNQNRHNQELAETLKQTSQHTSRASNKI